MQGCTGGWSVAGVAGGMSGWIAEGWAGGWYAGWSVVLASCVGWSFAGFPVGSGVGSRLLSTGDAGVDGIPAFWSAWMAGVCSAGGRVMPASSKTQCVAIFNRLVLLSR